MIKMRSTFILIIIFFVLPLLVYAGDIKKSKLEMLIITDANLAVPGIGAEGVLLGEEILKVTGRLSVREFRVSHFTKPLDLYKDVFKISVPHKLLFSRLYFNDNSGVVILTNEERVTGIIGFNNRITIDSIDMGKGIEYIIFNYGSENLSVINHEKSKLYLYRKDGISFIDDGPDNSVDLYIVFPPQSR